MNNIGWCDETWNPFVGCTQVSPGCEHCYAMKFAHRFKDVVGYDGLTTLVGERFLAWTGKIQCFANRLKEPYRFKKSLRIFVSSMSDPLNCARREPEFFKQVMTVVNDLPQHTWLFLSKYISKNIKDYTFNVFTETNDISPAILHFGKMLTHDIWLGVTVESQDYLWRLNSLKKFPVAKRFVSFEPLLGPVCSHNPILFKEAMQGINWAIIGAETGTHKCRPFPIPEARRIIECCRELNIPVYVKNVTNRPGCEDLQSFKDLG